MNPCAVVGTVLEIWRYPVKSMRGERVERADVTAQGIVGDRGWALVEAATGKRASAKRPDDYPGLMDFVARYAEPPRAGAPLPAVVITAPDGSQASSDDGAADALLSAWFKRELKLVPVTAESSHLDAFPLSLITTSTLHRLEELTPGSRFDPRRFRMNLTLDTGAPGFIENDWIGRRVGLGDSAWLKVTLPDARCVMTTLAQDDLPEDRDIMRTLMQHNRLEVGAPTPRPCAGVYADVAVAGEVGVGDRVVLD